MFEISSSRFILICSLIFVLMNYVFFKNAFSFANLPQDLAFVMTMPIALFAIFCLIFATVSVPYLAKFITVTLIMISAFSSYFMNAYGVIIDSSMLQNAIQTDVKEVGELLNTKMIFWILCFGVLPCIFIVMTKVNYKNPLKELISRSFIVLFSLAAILTIYLGFSKFYMPFFREHSELRKNLLPSYPLYQAVKLYKNTDKKPLVISSIGDDARLQDGQKRILVLVVGETERSANYSLNGYATHDTNLYTKQLNSVVSFANFYSCGTATAVSLPCMFSNLTRENYDANLAQSSQNVIDAIQKAGVDTYWLDNNSGFCKDVCKRVKNISDHGGSDFDKIIFDEAKNIVQNTDKTTLIVIHIQGSHGPTYYKRYPDEFKKFTPTCNTSKLQDCQYEEILNTYDNTILYTDYLIYDILQSLDAKGRDGEFTTALLFLGDHGESLGEGGLYLHGMPYSIAPDAQKHVPAIFYSSDAKINEKLAAQKDNLLSHDYLFDSLLGYFGIESLVYNSNLDIFKG